MENPREITFENLPFIVGCIYIEVDKIKNELNELRKFFEPKNPIELLTRNEVAEMLKCDLSTIHNWTKKGKLKKHCIGDRTYYKRSEVESALIAI